MNEDVVTKVLEEYIINEDLKKGLTEGFVNMALALEEKIRTRFNGLRVSSDCLACKSG